MQSFAGNVRRQISQSSRRSKILLLAAVLCGGIFLCYLPSIGEALEKKAVANAIESAWNAFTEWDWARAENEYRRAIAMDPDNADAHAGYGYTLNVVGRHAEALNEIELANDLEPDSIRYHLQAAWFLYCARRYDESIEMATKAISMPSNGTPAYFTLGMAYLAKGEYEKAIEAFEKQVGGFYLAPIAYARAMQGQEMAAREMLNELLRLREQRRFSAYAIAWVYAGLEDHGEAIRWLELAYAEHLVHLPLQMKTHVWDSLRPDPRFQHLLKRMNF
jgi:serine/threonine-protein kinase